MRENRKLRKGGGKGGVGRRANLLGLRGGGSEIGGSAVFELVRGGGGLGGWLDGKKELTIKNYLFSTYL